MPSFIEDIADAVSTEGLSDLLGMYCRYHNMPWWSADELLHEIWHQLDGAQDLETAETMREHERFLLAFMDRWRDVQSEEDFESACAARGEA